MKNLKEKKDKRETKLIIGGEEVTDPLLRGVIMTSAALVAFTLLVVLPVLLMGVYTTLAVMFGLISLCGLLHLILTSSGRRGLVQVTRDEAGKISMVTFDPSRAFDKLP